MNTLQVIKNNIEFKKLVKFVDKYLMEIMKQKTKVIDRIILNGSRENV